MPLAPRPVCSDLETPADASAGQRTSSIAVPRRRLPIHREMTGTLDLRHLPRIAPESARSLDQPSAANPPASQASAPWWPGQSGGRSQNGVDRPVADRGVSDVIWPTGRVAGERDVFRRTHTQASHDLALTSVFLLFAREHPERARFWFSEDAVERVR